MYDHALQINPNEAEIYTHKGNRINFLGIALAKLDKFDEAIIMYDRAL